MARQARLFLQAVLVAVVLVLSAATLLGTLVHFPIGADLHIPLEAARRWVNGLSPYVPEAFALPAGYDLPFLYPPVVLPIAAVLTALPPVVLVPAWIGGCVAVSVAACRRLGFRWPVALLALLWPPFAEGIVVGNVQLFIFGGFVWLFWPPGDPASGVAGAAPGRPGRARTAVDGTVASLIAAVKLSQVHPWLHLLRVDPRIAIVGAIPVAVALLATLPLIGPGLWIEWLAQLQQAADPDWIATGAPLSQLVGAGAARVVAIATIVAAVSIAWRRPAGALGLLVILAAPTLHTHYWLFALPAMLVVRREIGLTAAILIATHNPVAAWLAIALVGWTFAAGRSWPWLYEDGAVSPDKAGGSPPR